MRGMRLLPSRILLLLVFVGSFPGRRCARAFTLNNNYQREPEPLRCRLQRGDGNSPLSTRNSQSLLHLPSSHLVFPGGGIFFYWQAGAVQYLRDQGYDLKGLSMSGASAGALTATLTASDVDFYAATELALDLSEQAGVWERTKGLQGIWGPLVEAWLDELLPDDAAEHVAGRLSVLVTPIPTFGKTRIDEFKDKEDLISCAMASVHIPWFLDGRLTYSFRNKQHIDGSFLATSKDYIPPNQDCRSIVLDYRRDPAMEGRALEFVQARSKDSIWALLEQGKQYAKTMERQDHFKSLTS